MSTLTDLRRLITTDRPSTYSSGVVVSVAANGAAVVRVRTRTIVCTSVVSVVAGDVVNVQGTLITSKQTQITRRLPEYRV